MKKHLVLLTILASLMSCSEQSVKSSNSNNNSNSSPSQTPTDPSVGYGLGSSSRSLTCYGNLDDGDGKGEKAITNYIVNLAGSQSWYPQKVMDGASLVFPTKRETELVFKNVSTFKVRLKANAQPPQGSFCPGQSGTPSLAQPYEKITAKIKFYYSELKNNLWTKKGSPFKSSNISSLEVNKCSSPISVSESQLSRTDSPILVEITNVKKVITTIETDANGKTVYRNQSISISDSECFSVTLQIVNDSSDDFQKK